MGWNEPGGSNRDPWGEAAAIKVHPILTKSFASCPTSWAGCSVVKLAAAAAHVAARRA